MYYLYDRIINSPRDGANKRSKATDAAIDVFSVMSTACIAAIVELGDDDLNFNKNKCNTYVSAFLAGGFAVL